MKTYPTLLALGWLLSTQAFADGMVPDTSVVIVNEADGEASVSVTNTDGKLALLHVTLEDIPEDTESLLFVTRPCPGSRPTKASWCALSCATPRP